MAFDPRQTRAAVKHLRAADRVLGEVIDAVGPFRMKAERRRFLALSRSIVAQQISRTAANSIWARLQATLRPQRMTPASVAALSRDQLRAAGISPQKAAYLHDLAGKVLDGTVRLDRLGRMTDEQVMTELIQVKGIGVWTAQMFLMFSLARLDVFAPDDLGLRAAIRDLYGLRDLPDRQTSESIAQPWRPYATVACWYLWRSSELDSG